MNRCLTERERARRAEKGGGGASNRVYLESVKTTLPAKVAGAVVESNELRHHFACALGCCRFKDLTRLPERSRMHYLFTRRAEVDRLSALPIAAMRLHQMETQLRGASDLAARLRRTLFLTQDFQTSATLTGGLDFLRENRNPRSRLEGRAAGRSAGPWGQRTASSVSTSHRSTSQRRKKRRLPRLRLGIKPRRAQSSTVDFGIASKPATSLEVITSVRVSGRSVLGDETSTLVKPTAGRCETVAEIRAPIPHSPVLGQAGVPRYFGASSGSQLW